MLWIGVWRYRSGGAVVPLLISVFFVAAMLTWVAAQIRNDLLTNTDELLTAERSREMLLLGRGAVHDNFQVSFAKPPLQYWLTTLSLPRFENREMAVRIWPLVYGALTALALGLLAYLLAPSQPWLITLSTTFLLSCPLFLTEVARAFLDTGLTFFATLAIALAQLARRQPWWWMAVAVMCWLGALQKTPLILVIWLIILLIRLCFEPSTLRSRWVIGSLIFAAMLLLIWPLSQKLIYHESVRKILRFAEVVDLVGPGRLGARPYLEIPLRLVDTWPCGLFALISTGAFYLTSKENQTSGVREISILSLSIVGLAIVFNFRSVRYILPVVPCLCLLLGLLLVWTWKSGRTIYRASCVLLVMLSMAGLGMTRYIIDHRRGLGIVLSMSGPKATREMMDQRQTDAMSQKFLAEQIRAAEKPGTRIVIVDAYRSLLPPHFYLFYGDLPVPIAYYMTAELGRAHETPPAIGACTARDLADVRQIFSDVTVQSARGNFVCWTAPSEK